MNRSPSRATLLAGVAAATLGPGASPALAAPDVSASYATPSIDRWMYPFNFSTRGYRIAASAFSALGQEDVFEEDFGFTFDQRDAQVIVGFDFGPELDPATFGPCGPVVTSATVRVAVSTDLQFAYDPSVDPWQSYRPAGDPQAIADDDPGRPIEMFGVAFRDGFTAETFFEGTQAMPGPPFNASGVPLKETRSAYATDYAPTDRGRDVSNSVRDAFDPTVFAVGTTDEVAPGADVPALTDFAFELEVEHPDVQAYLAEAVGSGLLRLAIASLHPAASDPVSGGPGTGSFPTFFTKENLLGAGRAARLEITVAPGTPPGDADGNGRVDLDDFSVLAVGFGQSVTPGEGADFNTDGVIDLDDFSVLAVNFGVDCAP